MSQQRQRGRQVAAPSKAKSFNLFYVLIGLVAVVGTIVVVVAVASNSEKDSTSNVAQQPSIVSTSVNVPTASSNGTIPTPAPGNTETGTTSEGFYYKGSNDAPVTIVEYSDFQCPACAFHNQNLTPILRSDYIDTGKVRLIFHDFPLQMHPFAPKAAESARCAGEQGKFWDMHDALFGNQEEWSAASNPVESHFPKYAEEIGLDVDAFSACVNGNIYSEQIAQAYQSSVMAGINQTPTFVVDGTKVDVGELFNEIDAKLATVPETTTEDEPSESVPDEQQPSESESDEQQP